MKDGKKFGLWWIMAVLLAVCVAGWFIGELLGIRLVFAICAIAAAFAVGYLLTKEDEARKSESNERFNDVLSHMEHAIEQARQDALASREMQEQLHKRMMEELDGTCAQIIDTQKCLTACVNETAKASVEKLNGQMDQARKKLGDVSEQIDKSATAMEQRLEKNETNNAALIDKLGRQIAEQTQSIIKTVEKNEGARRKDATDTNSALDAMCGSFENAVAAYQEMESRMAALEQQNIHLQQLTTLIGTVRSDIAMINEVRGFVDEQKAGKKVRVVRDDENKIVVENLMNGDGVRIEKSKMYRDKKLVFEAEFNAVGKMVLSRSYNKNGNLDTEVTYAPEDHGKPTIRDMAKEVISGMKKNTKRK